MPTYPGFHPFEGEFPISRAFMKASEDKDEGDALSYENAGTADELELAVTSDTIVGVYHDKPRTSSDSDYASDVEKEYIRVIRNESQLWYANNESGTDAAQATDVGTSVDLNSADGLDVTSTSNGDFKITKVIDGDTVIGHFV